MIKLTIDVTLIPLIGIGSVVCVSFALSVTAFSWAFILFILLLELVIMKKLIIDTSRGHINLGRTEFIIVDM